MDLSDTNLDVDGNPLLSDYTNNVVPNVFTFSGVQVANNYVCATPTSVQLNVMGSPYYVAVLVDDPNFNDAVWSTYSSSSVAVNLWPQGWHEVWIGVRGHADAADAAVWQRKRLKLDYTPPPLVITSPASNIVNVPVIQLTGYSPEALVSISYDLSNAVAVVTNQQALITDQSYSTNTWEFTTNYFHCYDVPLTNGVNTITLHAMDLAGNVTMLATNIILDYSSKTAPVVEVDWPQNGDYLSGTNFAVSGQLDDPTATVSAQIVDTNSETNVVNGVVGRDGKFWVQNLPLNSGTNTVTLAVQNVLGNTTTTNLSLIQSPVVLTVDPVVAGQITVTGTINTGGYTVWVNGVQATMNGNNWTVQIPPITIGGGSVEAEAIPNGGGQ